MLICVASQTVTVDLATTGLCMLKIVNRKHWTRSNCQASSSNERRLLYRPCSYGERFGRPTSISKRS